MALKRFTVPKQYRVLLELHITQGQLESPEKKQNAAQFTVMEKSTVKLVHYHTKSMRSYFKNILYLLNSPPPPLPAKNPVSLHFFYLNIPYPDRLSAFWLRLVSRETATVKYHCITYGTLQCHKRQAQNNFGCLSVVCCCLEKRSEAILFRF